MTNLLRRLAAAFVEPPSGAGVDQRGRAGAPHPEPAGEDSGPGPPRAVVFRPPGRAPATHGRTVDAPHDPIPEPCDERSREGAIGGAIVLAGDASAIPVAAACAGELRVRAGASAALLCVWRPSAGAPPGDDMDLSGGEPDGGEPPPTPAGATTPAARRLAARLSAHELAATACGRLAWLQLDADPADAAANARRALVLADAPVVIALAAPRDAAFEPLFGELELAVAVLPADAEPALRDLVLATLPTRRRVIRPPLRPGPPRWAAMAGLGRLRSLTEEVE